jgi:hypothetical protein
MKRSRIRPVSAKRGKLAKARQKTREAVLERDKFVCQAQVPGCSLHATDVHEIKTRARGGSITDPDNCIALCRSCHSWITEHPAWAGEHGFMLHSWDGPAEARAARRERERFLHGEEVVGDDGEDA